MNDSNLDELKKLRAALAGLESQRAILGEAAEPALELLRSKIAILEKQEASLYAKLPTEERRIVTILFADIVGSTALAGSLDPEDWRQLVGQVHTMAGEQINKHAGTVLQYLGDGLLALFGSESSSEGDPENAVRAGLDIQAALASLQVALPVQMRIGIHTGLVVLGELGSAARRELTASGDAMNLASRLQSAAPPGGVLVSHDTYRSVRGTFEFAPQPPLTVKGKRDPVQSYLVLRARLRPFRMINRGVHGLETRTVGRESEQERLQAAFLSANQGRQLVWSQLVGEPGVGKSRLLADLSEWLDLRPEFMRLFRGRAFSGDASQPFSLVRRMWYDRFSIAEDEPLPQAETKWVIGFQELGKSDQVEPAHALGLLVGLPFEDCPDVQALRHDPAQLKGRASVVSRELLKGIRAETPIIILLEDLHLADSSSIEYLMSLLEMDRGSPEEISGAYILATSRPEWTPPQALLHLAELNPPRYVQIDLAPLSPAASHELALELLKQVDGVPEQVVRMIVDRSEGVPYYAEELVNLFIDRGVIDTSGDRWRFIAENLDPGQLPLTLQHLLLTRLLSLPPNQRLCLQHASVFGRRFWEAGLEALGISDSHAHLSPLQPRGFIDQQPESSFENDTEWSFHHNLLRDVTYESLLKRDRPGLHKAAAGWLERQARHADRISEFAGLLGEHSEHGGDLVSAADWYLQAGERAKDLGATREAQCFFDRALDLLPLDDLERRWRALLGRTDILGTLGEIEARQASVDALLTLAGQLDESRLADAYYRQGSTWDFLGNYRFAVQSYNTSRETAKRAGYTKVEALTLALIALDQNRLGNFSQAITAAQEAQVLIPEVDEATVARILNNLAVFYVESGDLARAAQLHSDQAALHHRLLDRASEANALSNLGYDYALLGLYSLARSALESALQLNRTVGARREGGYTLLNLGLIHWRCRDANLAQTLLDQGQCELEAVGDTFGFAAGLSYLALIMEESGDYVAAQQRNNEANGTFIKLGVPGYAADARAGMARCALALGDREAASRHAEDVWAHLQGNGSRGMEFPINGYLTCVQVFKGLGQLEKSHTALEQGYQELHQRANKISDPHWRSSYLENIPEHQAILDAWDRITASTVIHSI